MLHWPQKAFPVPVKRVPSSVAFADLADGTQRVRRNLLERFREAHGDKRIATIERKHRVLSEYPKMGCQIVCEE